MTHTARFFGRKSRKIYRRDGSYYNSFISYVPLLKTELNNPPLKEREKVDLKLDGITYLVVETAIRNLDGSYKYLMCYDQEVIEDEETENSKQKIKRSFFRRKLDENRSR